MLELSGITRSTYHDHLKQQGKDKYTAEKADIVEIYDANKGIYGYRRITEQLKKKGYSINHKAVLKLMKSHNLRGKQSKNGKYHFYKGEVGKIADNLLKRDFTANKPFEKLATDVTGVSQILCKHRKAVKNRAKIICWGGGLSATP